MMKEDGAMSELNLGELRTWVEQDREIDILALIDRCEAAEQERDALSVTLRDMNTAANEQAARIAELEAANAELLKAGEADYESMRADCTALRAKVERLMVYHADDEPSWRHRSEKLEVDRAVLRARLEKVGKHLTDAGYSVEGHGEPACVMSLAKEAKRLRARLGEAEEFIAAVACEDGFCPLACAKHSACEDGECRRDAFLATAGAEEPEHAPDCQFRRSYGILYCSCGLPGAAAAPPVTAGAEAEEEPARPECGYTKADMSLHGDHRLCGGPGLPATAGAEVHWPEYVSDPRDKQADADAGKEGE